MNERAKQIAAALEKVESTHRTHGRALIEFHKLIASAVEEFGPSVGLDSDVVAQAAAPKNPPTNDTGD